jgi:hypothetical protein
VIAVKPTVSEAQFARSVLELLGLAGWRCVHHRPAGTRDGWRTAVAGSGAVGWPDIFAVRGDRALAIELKAEHGSLQHEQRDWLIALEAAGIEVYVWKPSDWSEIEQVLGRARERLSWSQSVAPGQRAPRDSARPRPCRRRRRQRQLPGRLLAARLLVHLPGPRRVLAYRRRDDRVGRRGHVVTRLRQRRRLGGGDVLGRLPSA